jgi:hypothetical protein
VTSSIEIEVEYKDFHAYRDHMSHKLHVVGTCQVRGAGVAVSLRDHEGPPGINPKILPLDLEFTVTGESPSEQPVEWWGEWDNESYEEVEFRVGDEVKAPPPSLNIEDVY